MKRACESGLWLGVCLLVVTGCGTNPAQSKPAPSSPAQPSAPAGASDTDSRYKIALLGDATRADLLGKIAAAAKTKVHENQQQLTADLAKGVTIVGVVPLAFNDAPSHAKIVEGARLALLVVDATNGPMPIHREHLQMAHVASVPAVVVVFTMCEKIDDSELLELEELEMRELLTKFKFNGDKALIVFDDANTKTKNPKGISQIVEKLRGLAATSAK